MSELDGCCVLVSGSKLLNDKGVLASESKLLGDNDVLASGSRLLCDNGVLGRESKRLIDDRSARWYCRMYAVTCSGIIAAYSLLMDSTAARLIVE